MTPVDLSDFKNRFNYFRTRPITFTNVFLAKSPVAPDGRRHQGQIRWLRDANQMINVLVPGNRFGKSVVTAMKHIHRCVFRVGQPEPWNWTERYETKQGFEQTIGVTPVRQ